MTETVGKSVQNPLFGIWNIMNVPVPLILPLKASNERETSLIQMSFQLMNVLPASPVCWRSCFVKLTQIFCCCLDVSFTSFHLHKKSNVLISVRFTRDAFSRFAAARFFNNEKKQPLQSGLRDVFGMIQFVGGIILLVRIIRNVNFLDL